jgi:predicted RecB family nuclease
MTILLPAYAARSCPVKTHNAFNQTISHPVWEPDESLAELFDGGARFEQEILDRLVASFGGSVTDLRVVGDTPSAARADACLRAMQNGIDVIVGGWLPIDVVGHRVGCPDLLVRGADRYDGTSRYHPVEVKWHKIIERRGPARSPQPASPLRVSRFGQPGPEGAQELAGHGLRLGTREADLIQLAHYHRMLQSIGFADSDSALAAVIGTDEVLDEPVLAWVDLAEPLVRTFSRTQPEGWRLRSILERYDHEHVFRLDVASNAIRMTGDPSADPEPLVRPIVTSECRRCQWWEHCSQQLHPDDVSLRIDKSPLDVREIATLRRHGIATITQLASADLDGLLGWYLPEVRHRSGAESRLRVAARRARMLLDDSSLDRETTGPIDVPSADVEIDFDIETSSDGRVYLWGFLIRDAGVGTPTYLEFSRFCDLNSDTELELAAEALGWLQQQTLGPRTVRVFHYSAFEVSTIIRLAGQAASSPVLAWAADYATSQFVDLWEVMRSHFFGVGGLGLKAVAQQGPGFSWRDDEPGGLNSQRWFAEAVHGETSEIRSFARRRVLEYNEDDVTATARLREWLRAQ